MEERASMGEEGVKKTSMRKESAQEREEVDYFVSNALVSLRTCFGTS